MNTNLALPGRGNGRRRHCAFTLIELMAVIVAVFILAALVVPALGRSGDNGARMVCLNNLRQLGMAATMYAGDNRDYLAYCNYDGGAGNTPGWLYNPTANGIPNPTILPYRSSPTTAWQTGLWFKYAQDPKYYLCPVDIESPDYAQKRRVNRLSSYVMDGAACNFGGGGANQTCKITDVWSPGCWLLWEVDSTAAATNFASAFNDGANFPNATEGPGRIHTANGAEILSVAGNVRFTTTRDIQSIETTPGPGPGPGGKTLAWWSPFSANGH